MQSFMRKKNTSYDQGIAQALMTSLSALPKEKRTSAVQDYIELLKTVEDPQPSGKTGIESYDGGVFGDAPVTERRFVPDFDQLDEYVRALKNLGTKIVLVSGTFDLFHIGHARYLEAARQHGDFMIVGVDSDEKVRKRKGPNRPLVPEQERIELLCHIRGVGFVTIKHASQPKWQLINTVKPDTLIAISETYTDGQIKELEEKYCGRVVILPRQASTSTSARIRNFQMNANGDVARKALEALQEVLGPLVENNDKK